MSKKHVFISHAWGAEKQGHQWAVHLSERLKKYGINCWIDDQEHNLSPGDGLNRQIQLAIQDCPAFVAILCKSYKTRKNCTAELDHAFTHKKDPIPVVREKLAPGDFPERLKTYDPTVYLEMFDVPGFDANLPKLVKAIRQKQRMPSWLRLGLTVIGIALAGSLLFFAWNWGHQTNNRMSRDTSLNDSSPVISREDQITVPKDGGRASFHKGSGQGGLVTIEGESKQLKPDEVIILVVYPSDGNHYPQTNQPKGIIPGPDGHWSAEVQVGDDGNPPQAGQSFIVRMYVLPTKDYLSVKTDNSETGGKAKWPPPSEAYLSERAKAMFTLQ